MPAKSKSQKRFMSMVKAVQSGSLSSSDVSQSVRDAADSMKKKDVEDFVDTDEEGLPDKVEEISTSFDPEKRRSLRPGEFEIMKGRGDEQRWFYVNNEEDAKTLVALGRNWGYPTGITKSKAKSKLDKGYYINEDSVKGGLADKLDIDSIAEKHNVSVDQINKQVEMGTKIEREHTDSDKIAREIALDHLTEDPEYYTKLKKMETESRHIRISSLVPLSVLNEANADVSVYKVTSGANGKHIGWTAEFRDDNGQSRTIRYSDTNKGTVRGKIQNDARKMRLFVTSLNFVD